MSLLGVVVVLQIVIILLLCEPLKQRRRTLNWLVPIGAVFLLVDHNVSTIFSLILAVMVAIKHHIVISVLMALASVFLCAYWLDHRQNRAIKKGSQAAFDQRVKELMKDFQYSYDDAVAAANRVKESVK